MALGDNNKNQEFYPTTYSKYNLTNVTNSVDPSGLSVSFWNGLLKLTISPAKQDGAGKTIYDNENNISAHITHTKARILAEEIKIFINDPQVYNSSGISSGNHLISISNGNELNTTIPCIIIRKIDEDGKIESSFAYQFKDGTVNFAIRNYSSEDNKYDTVKYDDLELKQFVTLLEEYYKAMTSAQAYSVLDTLRFEHGRHSNKLDAISEKLGIENTTVNGYKKYNKKSYNFNSNQSSLDDFDDE